jgi:hypothetical protein
MRNVLADSCKIIIQDLKLCPFRKGKNGKLEVLFKKAFISNNYKQKIVSLYMSNITHKKSL